MEQPTAPTLALVRAHRAAILNVAARFGATHVRVVGSVARQEATPASDVDLLVTLVGRHTVFDLVGLWMELEAVLGHAVSIIPDSIDDEAFLRSVLADAVAL